MMTAATATATATPTATTTTTTTITLSARTSTDRNDATVETFLYYNRQKRSVVNRTLDEIAIELGVSPAYAANVAAMLDGQNGPASASTSAPTALAIGNAPTSTTGAVNDVETPENNANVPNPKPGKGGNKKQNDGQQPPAKKARPPKPEVHSA